MLERLFATAEQSQLSSRYRTTSYNGLCGFLEQGSKSEIQKLQDLCNGPLIWDRALTLYLQRAQDPQSRPMRQLLTTLARLLEARRASVNENHSLENNMMRKPVSRCMEHIYGHEDMSCVKSSMLVLDMFISKRMVDPAFLVDPSLIKESICLKAEVDTPCESSPGKLVDYFISNVLRWARHMDIVPSARRLLVSFARATLALSSFPMSVDHAQGAMPVWVLPVQRMIDEYPDMLEVLEQHIIPDLLRVDPIATSKFLQELPLEELLCGNSGMVPEKDIRFCLLVFRVMSEMQLPIDLSRHDRPLVAADTWADQFSKGSFRPPEARRLPLPERLASSLLYHASCDVRTASLSLLIRSSTTTQPLSTFCLYTLKCALPHFCLEPDAKVRNEVVSVIKRLCVRLQGAITRMRKLQQAGSSQEDVNQSGFKNCAREAFSSESIMLRIHVEFVTWLYNFLSSELQLTASHSRHIVALRSLGFVVSSGLNVITEVGTLPEKNS